MADGAGGFEVEIVRVDGSFANLVHGGQVLRRVRHNGYAEYYARIEEQRLREAAARPRPCLCCGATMLSTGAHHRLCDPCRRTKHA